MEQLLAYMQKEHLDGMFISRPVNVKYVSHYTGEDSWLFITEQEKFFLTDPRYTEQVSYECPDYTILNWRDTYGSIGKALAYAAEKVGAKTIGYEASHLTVEQYQNLQSEVKAELVPADGIIDKIQIHPVFLHNHNRHFSSFKHGKQTRSVLRRNRISIKKPSVFIEAKLSI
jgi:Xaa-Pro aminopeptidase